MMQEETDNCQPADLAGSLSMCLILTVAFTLALVMAGCGSGPATSTSSGSSEETVFTPVLVSFVGGDTAPVRGTDGRYYVVYELVLANATPVPASLEAVEALDAADGTEVLRLEDEDLIEALRTLGMQPVEDASLPPNESRLLFLTASFESEEDVPDALDHRIEAMAADHPGPAEPAPVSYRAGLLNLSRHTTPVFSPPLEGEGWLVFNGCCALKGAHRGAVQPFNAELFDSQRFAIDWMRVDEDGRIVTGDPSDVSNWVNYGARVMAAADGVVVATLDSLEDNVPGALPDPSLITTETVDGNHVVLDHGNGLYSFYAHLQPGSVEVEVGDEVQAGDQLGLLGNTGNSSAPHLHFHVMSGPSPLASDGIPYVFDSFLAAGDAGDEAEFDRALQGEASLPRRAELNPSEHENELPLDNTIVDFPSE